VSYSAAFLSLANRANVQAGETVLITGAAGTVGRAATDIAHWLGARVIGALRAPTVNLAADVVLDSSAGDLATAVRAATGGVGADASLDTVGGELFGPVLDSVRYGGRSVVIASVGSPVTSLNVTGIYRNERSIFGVNTLQLMLADGGEILDALRLGFEASALPEPRVLTYPFEAAVAAYKAVLAGTGGAKIVLVP
jgi:NADPH:quinone reductase-like Zn-dependent oxidoreductase